MTGRSITELIRDCYGGDPAEPDFSFVATAVDQRPYDAVIGRIGELDSLRLREYTDTNNHVCFGYAITDGTHRWALELSMLAPLGVLSRTADNTWQRLLRPDAEDLTPTERAIFAVLVEEDITFPDRSTLEEPLEMSLFYTDPENVRIYHALFSDEDFLPWEFAGR